MNSYNVKHWTYDPASISRRRDDLCMCVQGDDFKTSIKYSKLVVCSVLTKQISFDARVLKL